MEQAIQIKAEFTTDPEMLKFIVDRPVYADGSVHFAGKAEAKGSPLAQGNPLAERLFEIEHVAEVTLAGSVVTVKKAPQGAWTTIAKPIGAEIRAHLQRAQEAMLAEARKNPASANSMRVRIQELIDSKINPGVAGHGGVVTLLDVKDNVAYLKLGGGCQGCGMVDVTLKQGIERILKAEVPELQEVVDSTDHRSGTNPYYQPGK